MPPKSPIPASLGLNGQTPDDQTAPPLLDGVTGPHDEAPDPFDPQALRLSQDLAAALAAKEALLTMPVRRPAREWFVRVHADPAYQLHTAMLELKETRELYLLSPPLWPVLAQESTFVTRMLFLTVNRQQDPFFWPVRLPTPDGRIDDWSRSALDAANLAQSTWVRVTPNTSLGAYTVVYADHATQPIWPDLAMGALLRLAFRERFIESLDHTVLRQLRGEV